MGINMHLFVSCDLIQNFFDPNKVQIKISFLLDVSNGRSRPEEFKDIEVFVDSEEQNRLKRANVGKFLGLVHIQRLTARLAGKDQKTRLSRRLREGIIMRHPLGKIMILCLVTGYNIFLTKMKYK